MGQKIFLEPKNNMWEDSVGLVLMFSESLTNDGSKSRNFCTFKIRHQVFFHGRVSWHQALGISFCEDSTNSSAPMCVLSVPVAWVSAVMEDMATGFKVEEKKNGRRHMVGSKDPPEQFTITCSWPKAFALAVFSAWQDFPSDISHCLQCFT